LSGVVADSKCNDVREARTDPMMWMPIQQAVFKAKFAMLRVRAGSEAEVARNDDGDCASVDDPQNHDT
jgi:hypothetical protein